MPEATPETEAQVGLTVEELADRLPKNLLGGDATEEEAAPTETQEVEEVPEETESAEEAEGQSEEEEETEEAESVRRWKVKAAGEEVEVDESELIKGYQREVDYRKKTAEVAEQKRTLEAERQHYSQALQQFIPVLQKQMEDKFAEVDWVQLARDDPGEYVARKAEFDRHQSNLQMAIAEQERIKSQAQQEQHAQLRERLQTESKRLYELHPEFADPEKGKVAREGVKSYLRKTGFSEDEIAGVADARAVSLAYKAYLYDKAQQAKSQGAKVIEKAPKVQKPGTSGKADPKATAARAAAEKLRKSGSVDDLAEYLGTIGVGNSN